MTEQAAQSADPMTARTMPELIRASAAAYGEEVAIVLRNDGVDTDHLSFRELERRSARLAKGLLAKGAGKGTRIGFIYGNGPDFMIALAATCRIGAIAIPVSTLIKSNELVRVLRQSDLDTLIVQRSFLGHDYAERVADALPALREHAARPLQIAEAPFLRAIYSTGDELPTGFDLFDDLFAAGETVGDTLLKAVEESVHPTDQMIEIYTSGSMALPKGVRHAHGPVLFRTHSLRPHLGPERGKERSVSLPMFWVGGLMMFLLPCLEVGAIAVCSDRTLSNSRVAIGSVLAEDDLALMKGKPPYWGLGMTETLGPYAWSDEFRASGHPVCAPMDNFLEGFEVRVADEADQPVGDGGTGEVQIRGYAFTDGLHKVERDVHFTADGYYRTGDLCLVEGSRLIFVGRSGDMIKSASSNVSPAEVEMELQDLTGVQNAYVVGIPD
jgi:acyl-CoA synthetase (AMP-forming)/AMP-acid ligase II